MEVDVPDTPSELGFPQRAWRPYQRQTVQRIVSAEPRSVTVLCAPPGAGKSLIALGAARMYARYQQYTTVLTHQRTLQDQYLEYDIDPPVRSAKGRDNFPCILPEEDEVSAARAPCVVSHFVCHEAFSEVGRLPNCPHYRQKALANASTIRVLNYPYYFLQTKQGQFGTNLLVCDEGHHLGSAILQAETVRFTRDQRALLAGWKLSMPSASDGTLLTDTPEVSDWTHAVARQCYAMRGTKMERAEREVVRAIESACGHLQLLCRINATAVHLGGDIVPVIPEELSTHVFSTLRAPAKVVVMSASVYDAPYTAARLGLPADHAHFIDLPSAFPKTRRPIYVRPILRMNMESTKDAGALRKVVDELDTIAGRYVGRKGIIHCGSYQLGRDLFERTRLRSRWIVAEARNNRLEEFVASEDGIYVSPSAYEGLDMYDDRCRFNIIAKLSWPNRGDPVTALQLARIPGFNEHEAASALIQAVGRGVRHPDDWCHNFILDATFWQLWARTKDKLPRWFTESIVMPMK